MKKLINLIKSKLKMVDYEDGLGYQSQKLCLLVPYKHDRTLSRVYVINPFRKKINSLYDGILTPNKQKSKFFKKYVLLQERKNGYKKYQMLGFHYL